MLRRAVLVALAGLLLLAPGASADGDPASDVLNIQNVFLPYAPPDKAAGDQLKATAKRAQEAGYEVRVGVIQSAIDLGSIPDAFGKPQQYAEFLAKELVQLYGKKVGTGVLIVMPAGFGVAGKPFSDAERAALKQVEVSSNADSTALVKAANAALIAMAKADGKDIGTAAASASGGSGGVIAAIVLGVLLLVAVGLGVAVRLRRGQSPGGNT